MTDVPSTDALLAETAWLRRLALALAGDAHLADDVVQDALLAALRQPARAVQSPRAWLAVVTRHLVRRHRRREARRALVERAASRSEAVPPAGELVDRALLHRSAVDAVLALDEPYRTTLLLRTVSTGAPIRRATAAGASPSR